MTKNKTMMKRGTNNEDSLLKSNFTADNS